MSDCTYSLHTERLSSYASIFQLKMREEGPPLSAIPTPISSHLHQLGRNIQCPETEPEDRVTLSARPKPHPGSLDRNT